MAEQNGKFEVIKVSRNREYLLLKYENVYYVVDSPENKQGVVRTPGGALLSTSYLSLAERIFEDIQKYGAQCMEPKSILPWHYTMIDSFSKMEHSEVEAILDQCFLQRRDWTLNIHQNDDDWIRIFGEKNERKAAIREWLSHCTHMQMTAACCIGNAYESINIAFVLARLMENFEGKELNQRIHSLARFVTNHSHFLYGTAEEMVENFKNFELYYGIHLKEEGPIIHEKIDEGEETNAYIGKEISVEALIGRNFYLFSDMARADEQPFELELGDLDLDLDDKNDDSEDKDEAEFEKEHNELEDYLPNHCWVKRISAVEDDDEVYHLIVVTLDDSGKIDGIRIILEEACSMNGGAFMIPYTQLQGSKSYEEMDYMPDDVAEELDALIGGRYLKKDFSFIGKRLPQAMIDAGGDGGSDTEYTYALQSVYRMAYMHISIHTDEDGIIEDFSYSSYLSSGSSYGDMFSRPIASSDRKDEAIDMLLYILDQYTEKEYKAFTETSC